MLVYGTYTHWTTHSSKPLITNLTSIDRRSHTFSRSKTRWMSWVSRDGSTFVMTRSSALGKPISKFMCVCSEHFLPDDFSKNTPNPQRKRIKQGVVPSQKIPVRAYEKTNQETRKLPQKRLLPEEVSSLEADENFLTSPQIHFGCQASESEVNNVKRVKSQKSYGKYKDPLVHVNFVSEKSFEDKATQTDIRDFTLFEILDSDKKLECFTGINHSVLNDIERCCYNVADYNKYCVAFLKINLVLVFVKLRLNIPFACLAILFNMSPSTCTRHFYTTVELVAVALKPAIYWPSREEVLSKLPKCFHKFKDTRVVLDCTEVSVQKCKCLSCRIKMYSHYKGTQTLKWMIGITPSGLISYVSEGYGGRASDKSIVLKENISLCEPYTAIMVDKGFMIEKECEQNYIKLIRPPFLKKNTQLSKNDAELTADIARARVHVERAIQRIKTYRIVTNKIEWYLVPHMNNIMWIIGALVNLGPPILADDKFDEHEEVEDVM